MSGQYRLKAVVGIWNKRGARKFIADARASGFVEHYIEENRGLFMGSVFTLWLHSYEDRVAMHSFLRDLFHALTGDTF